MVTESLPPVEADISETTENYLKRIYILTIKNKYARISDIANAMGRSRSTVTGAIQKMAIDGLVNYEKYGKITLTETGEEIAKSVHINYSVINEFLMTLGLPEKIANLDACSMEHSINEMTIKTIKEFVNLLKNDEEGINLMKKFYNEKIM